MKKTGLIAVLAGICCLLGEGNLLAQTVTFNVNLKPQLEDSTFIPGRDNIQIVGSVPPLNTPTPYYLTDEEPIDSVYSATIDFSPRFRNQTITYNYEMMVNYQKQTENLPRSLLLRQQEVELDALYFNAFAW